MEYSVNMNFDVSTVSTASVFDTARCLIGLNAVDESEVTRYLPNLRQLLETGWEEQFVESRWGEIELIRLWQLVDTQYYPQAGIDVATHQEMNNYGILAKWVSQCKNLKEAFLLFIDNIQLLNPSECWSFSETQSEYKIELSFSNKVSYPDIAIHRSMISLLVWARELSGVPIKAEKIAWPNINDAIRQSLAEFSEKIKESTHKHILVLKKEVLEYEILKADPYLKRVLAQQASKVQCNPIMRLSDRVFHLFQKDIQYYRNIDNVCSYLHLSQSTMYRRLKQENTQFSKLLDEYRKIQYELLTKGSMSSEGISSTLGFGDVSSFLKAKKRWYKGAG